MVLDDVNSARGNLDMIASIRPESWSAVPGDWYYLVAICDAREGKSESLTENLRKAFAGESDYDLKNKAALDVEFINYSDAVKAAMN